jgi:hypothetical protein
MDGTIADAIGRAGYAHRRVSKPPAIGAMSPRAVGWAIAAGLACVPMLLMMLGPWLLTDRSIVEFETVDDLYHSVADLVCQGRIPYRDFPFEYPIGSLPQIVLPIVAGRGVLAYRTAYIAEMLVLNALLVLVLARQVEQQEGRAAVPRRLAWYLLCYLFLCRLIVSRLDVVPALLAFLAAVGWFGGRPIRGGMLAALGGLVKVVPALTVLPAGIRELSHRRQTGLRGTIAFGCAFALGIAAWGALAGPGMLRSIRYHGERGLEIESMYAGLLMLVGRLTGIPMASHNAFGSTELDFAWAPSAVAASRYVQLLALALTLAPFIRSDRRSGVQCTGALLLAFLATAPVLSPQFLIWVLPFILVMGGPLGRRVRPLFALSCGLTFLIYPMLFNRGLQPLWMPAILVLNLRNALLIAIWALMAFGTSGESEFSADRPTVR